MSYKCSYKRCRAEGDYVGAITENGDRYHLCQKHWNILASNEESTLKRLPKVANPEKLK